jgi:sialidase-1
LLVFMFACKKGKREWDLSGPDKDPVIDLNEGDTTFNYIFRQRYEGYACYRIPALVRAKDGALIAFAEARRNSCSDIGDIDLVMKRSTDNGKTWGGIQKIWDDGANICGNPAPVLDESTGVIHLLLTWNFGTDDISDINKGTSKDTRRVFISSSSDNGVTWSAPKEITGTTKRPEWGWYATGPCHGIQLKEGPQAGRLVIPCDFIEKGSGGRSFSHVIYSDDHGATWQIGGISPLDKANESAVAELSDGKLMLNMRHAGSRYVATSDDFGITWKNMKADANLVDPTCQGSLLSAKVDNKHTLFFSNPASTRREKMTIKLSENDGVAWPKKYEVYKGPSAYSDLIMMSGTEIGILYEAGTASPYTGISFKSVPLTEFK